MTNSVYTYMYTCVHNPYPCEVLQRVHAPQSVGMSTYSGVRGKLSPKGPIQKSMDRDGTEFDRVFWSKQKILKCKLPYITTFMSSLHKSIKLQQK